MLSKKQTLKLFSVLILATTLSAACSFAQPSEMIVNGGFETGDFTGWTRIEKPAGFQGKITSIDPHSGNYCLRLEGGDAIEQTFSPPVDPTDYLTFWVKIDELNQPSGLWRVFSITLEFSGGTRTTYPISSADWSLTWKLFEILVRLIITKPPFETEIVTKITIEAVAGIVGSVYFDDISLLGSEAPSPISLFGFSSQIIFALAMITITTSLFFKRSRN